jgi:hypothetical protein
MTSHNGSILMVMAMEIIKLETTLIRASTMLRQAHVRPSTVLVALTAMVTDIRMLTQTGLHIRSDLLMHSQLLQRNGMILMAMLTVMNHSVQIPMLV